MCDSFKKRNWFSCLPSFISKNLTDVQIDFGSQPYLPGTSSFTKLLSCQHSPSLSALPPSHQRLSTSIPPLGCRPRGRCCCFLCACLWLSSMGSTWQRMCVAGLCLDTSVSPSLLSLHATQRENWWWRRCVQGWLFKCCRQEDLGQKVCICEVLKSLFSISWVSLLFQTERNDLQCLFSKVINHENANAKFQIRWKF